MDETEPFVKQSMLFIASVELSAVFSQVSLRKEGTFY